MDGKGGIMMCKLKGRMDKGHYDVHYEVEKGGKGGWKRWHYDVCKLKGRMDVQIK